MTRTERAIIKWFHRDSIPEVVVTILSLSAIGWSGGLVFNDRWMVGQQFVDTYRWLPRSGWAVLFVLLGAAYLLSVWGPYRSVGFRVLCSVAFTLTWSVWGITVGLAYAQGGIPIPSATFAGLHAALACLWAIERRHGLPASTPLPLRRIQ